MKTNTIISYIKTILLAIVLALIIKNFLFNISIVKGNSMNPTLHNNDVLFCLSIKKFFSIDRDDIVVLKLKTENKNFIKRVIAKPNDRVIISNGKVYVNNKELEENYIQTDFTEGNFDIKLAKNQYFVLGDNRLPGASEDSRFFGPVDKSEIKSVAVLRFFPFSKIQLFN